MAKIKEAIEEFTPDARLVDERGPTAQRLHHAGPNHEAGHSGQITMRDCPLEKALRKKFKSPEGMMVTLIGPDQYNAGIKFRLHWYHSGIAPTIGSMDLGGIAARNVFAYGPMPKSEQQLFHRQRYRQACERVGLRTELVLSDVICREKPLDEIGMAQLGIGNRPQAESAVKALFVNGLDLLVELWGLRTR